MNEHKVTCLLCLIICHLCLLAFYHPDPEMYSDFVPNTVWGNVWMMYVNIIFNNNIYSPHSSALLSVDFSLYRRNH